MNLLKILAGTLVLCLWSQSAAADHEATEHSDGTVKSFIAVDPPQVLDMTPFEDELGKKVELKELGGKYLLVNLWATWCPPCIRELPALDRLQKTFGGKHFEVVAVSIDQQGAEPSIKMLKRLGIKNLDFYYAKPKAVGRSLPVDVLPASFIIDREGRLIRYVRSYINWDSPEALSYFWGLITTPVKS